MSLLGFVSNFYKSPNKFEKHSLFTSCVFYIDRSQNTKQLNDTFVLYSTCQIKDNLIGSVLYFYNNVTLGICFQLLQIPKQIY